MKILGREPTLFIAVISSGIVVLGTFGLHWLSGQQAGLIVAAINAVALAVNAYTVKPVAPAAFTYAIAALVAVVAAYGINVSAETLAAINLAVVPVLALLTRNQVSPQETAVSAA
jgi:hypothetical protein